ncbi:MAG: hypothetical protein QM501_06605 [Gimesia sp.]
MLSLPFFITTYGIMMQYKAITALHLDKIPEINQLPPELQESLRIVSQVFPFKTNRYIIEQLIDWSQVPDDPIFKLNFPQKEMLPSEDYALLRNLLRQQASPAEIEMAVHKIRQRLIPPAPTPNSKLPGISRPIVPGVWWPFQETIIAIPFHSNTCFAYCNYCSRWMKHTEDVFDPFYDDATLLLPFLREHPQVSDILITGSDPLFMRASILKRYVLPLLEVESLRNIRFASKSLGYWPQRFVSDKDSAELLDLFREISAKGKHVTVVAHLTHPREISTEITKQAIRKILSANAVIRCQSPLIRGVNDNPQVLADLWNCQVQLGMVPYYLFTEADAGPGEFFKVPYAEALSIFQSAYSQVSGLARTIRGPVIADSGTKTLLDGVIDIAGKKHFILKAIQSPNAKDVGKIILADYQKTASRPEELTSLQTSDNLAPKR